MTPKVGCLILVRTPNTLSLGVRMPQTGSEGHMRATSGRAVRIALLTVVSGVAVLSVSAEAAPPKGPCAVSKEVDVPAKMRDGVTLLADVYRPAESGSYP